jgi:hypothetical protein
MKLIGYDIDGVLTAGIVPEGNWVVISGRTYAEYDDFVKSLASKTPVYIRCTGEYGDRKAAGEWKAQMIKLLGVSKFYEDDALQSMIIQKMNPDCEIILVK